MNILNKFGVFLLGLSMFACGKDTPAYEELTDSKEGANVFIARVNNGVQNLTIFPYLEERTLPFNVGLGMVGYPSGDIKITLSESTGQIIDSLNAVRVANGQEPYELFPADSYNIDNLELTIAKGELYSGYSTLTYHPEAFASDKDYLLAFTITDASGYPINPSTKTIIFVAPHLEERPASTKGWIATASSEQLNGENTGLASAVLDGDLNTIWHSRYDPEPSTIFPHWLSFDMINETYVTKIAMAPRQNNSRGFTKFKLEGSLDGKTWIILGDNLTFDPANKSYQSYPIEPQNLKNIRITMLEGLQDLTFLAEFVVYSY
ncbi:protein of unknown function [bacterium A37T11]|nr:protein of unknown function [bacterium A37T11]